MILKSIRNALQISSEVGDLITLTLFKGSRWRVKKLTYKISKYPKMLEKESVNMEIAKAFSTWSNHTNLIFQLKRTGQVSDQ